MHNSLWCLDTIVECLGDMVGGGGGGGAEVYFRSYFYVTKYLYHLTSAIDSYSFPVLMDMCTTGSGVWIQL